MMLRDQAFGGVVARQRVGGLLFKMLAYQGTHMAVDMRVTVGGLPNGELGSTSLFLGFKHSHLQRRLLDQTIIRSH